MPRPDLPSPNQRARRSHGSQRPQPFDEPLRHRGRRKRGRDLDDGGIVVEPDKPLNLSGGAAAALEFDD